MHYNEAARERSAKKIEKNSHGCSDWDVKAVSGICRICQLFMTSPAAQHTIVELLHTLKHKSLGDQNDASWGSEHEPHGTPSQSRKRALFMTEHSLGAACSLRVTHGAERDVHPRVQRLHKLTFNLT